MTIPGSEITWLYVPLTITSTQEDVLATSAFERPSHDGVMLALYAIIVQLGSIFVPLKMCPDLVLDV
jgi:hypothetical protein